MGYIFIFGTILFTVYGQMILKWRLNILQFKIPNGGVADIVSGFAKIIFDPFILSGFLAAFVASIFWMAAMTKFEITYAYPFMSLSPALVFLLGVLFLGEAFTMGKLLGLVIIVMGIIVTVKF